VTGDQIWTNHCEAEGIGRKHQICSSASCRQNSVECFGIIRDLSLCNFNSQEYQILWHAAWQGQWLTYWRLSSFCCTAIITASIETLQRLQS